MLHESSKAGHDMQCTFSLNWGTLVRDFRFLQSRPHYSSSDLVLILQSTRKHRVYWYDFTLRVPEYFVTISRGVYLALWLF